MMKKILILAATMLLLAAPIAWAAPKIEIVLTAEVELMEVVDGKEVVAIDANSGNAKTNTAVSAGNYGDFS